MAMGMKDTMMSIILLDRMKNFVGRKQQDKMGDVPMVDREDRGVENGVIQEMN